MQPTAQNEAREALHAIDHARRGVVAEVGLPRWYWLLAAGWIALTVAVAVLLDADGGEHASTFAGIFVAAVVGFGGPEILRVLRRWARA